MLFLGNEYFIKTKTFREMSCEMQNSQSIAIYLKRIYLQKLLKLEKSSFSKQHKINHGIQIIFILFQSFGQSMRNMLFLLSGKKPLQYRCIENIANQNADKRLHTGRYYTQP